MAVQEPFPIIFARHRQVVGDIADAHASAGHVSLFHPHSGQLGTDAAKEPALSLSEMIIPSAVVEQAPKGVGVERANVDTSPRPTLDAYQTVHRRRFPDVGRVLQPIPVICHAR